MKRLIPLLLALTLAVLGVAPVQAMPQSAPAAAVRVRIRPAVATVNVGAQRQLKASVSGVRGERAIEWAVVRGEDVGAVDENGRVTGLKPGTMYVRATDALTGRYAERKVAVKAVRIESVRMQEDDRSIVLDPGESRTLKAPVILPAGAAITAPKPRWSSGNSNTATVDRNGVVTGVKPGVTRILCQVGGKQAYSVVRVRGEYVDITLSAVGDVILGGDPTPKSALQRSTEQVFKDLLAQYGPDYPFKNVAHIFKSDDVTIANLEGTLTTAGGARKKTHVFRGDPDYAQMLVRNGVEVVTLANNHSLDFGVRGLKQTQGSLNVAGVKWNDFSANGTYVVEKKGMKVRIGFAGFQTPVPSATIQKRVKELKRRCDVAVVSFHWTDTREWTAMNYPSDRARAKLAIDAGADLVLGHHRHLPSGIEMYKGKYIAFDLSNFIVGIKHKAYPDGTPMTDSMIFQWTFRIDTRREIENVGIKVIPVTTTTSTETYPETDSFGEAGAPVNNFQPDILKGADGEAVRSNIRKLSTVDFD